MTRDDVCEHGKPGTDLLPESMTILLGETAADNRYPCGLNACFSSIKKLENAFLSESGP